MLHTFLRLIEQGQVGSQQDLAEALSVPVALIVQMAEQLTRQGYLTESSSCSSNCNGCSLQAACDLKRPPRFWILTQKGQSALAK